MKGVFKILGKSLIGIPLMIFFYELFNLTISIVMGQYVRIDEFKLDEVINVYIGNAIMGYGMALMFNYIDYCAEENQEKRTQDMIGVLGLIFAIITIVLSIYEGNLGFGLLGVAIISLVMCVLYFVVFLLSGKEIKKINKKIKENEEKKD